MNTDKYYGKYRAVVSDVQDPLAMGRVKVHCPKIYDEDESDWCLVDSPLDVWIPFREGDAVWVEFEEGDSDYPIVTHSWWAEKEIPVVDKAKDKRDKIYRLITTDGFIIELNEITGERCIAITDPDHNNIVIDTEAGNILLTAKNKVIVDADFEVTGNSTLEGTLNVKGNTTLQSNLDVSVNTHILHDLTVDGMSNVGGLGGKSIHGETLSIDTWGTIGTTLNVGSTTTLGGTLSVTGAITANNSLSVAGTLNVSGTSTLSITNITGTLTVSGATTLSGAVQVNSTLNASGSITAPNLQYKP